MARCCHRMPVIVSAEPQADAARMIGQLAYGLKDVLCAAAVVPAVRPLAHVMVRVYMLTHPLIIRCDLQRDNVRWVCARSFWSAGLVHKRLNVKHHVPSSQSCPMDTDSEQSRPSKIRGRSRVQSRSSCTSGQQYISSMNGSTAETAAPSARSQRCAVWPDRNNTFNEV